MCRDAIGRRSRGTRCKKRHLGRALGHKKRPKYRRYFGRDRAIYAGRGQGFVRPAGRGYHISEFRTELDTRLCRDYSKAGAWSFRDGRPRPKSLEGKRIRVRGFVEARTGPRIEVLQVGQIEQIGDK